MNLFQSSLGCGLATSVDNSHLKCIIVICLAVPVQVKEVSMRRMKGSRYLLKLVWSDGTCSEVSQCFQDLKATYDEVNFFFSSHAHTYCSWQLLITPSRLPHRS